jgi:hypothetical protein
MNAGRLAFLLIDLHQNHASEDKPPSGVRRGQSADLAAPRDEKRDGRPDGDNHDRRPGRRRGVRPVWLGGSGGSAASDVTAT